MEDLKKIIEELEKQMNKTTPMVKGSLYEVRKKCNYKNCKKCQSGELHYVIQFTFTDKNLGRSTTSIKKEFYKDVKNAWDEYKTITELEQQLKKKLSDFFKKIKNNKNERIVPIRKYLAALKKGAKSED